MDLNWTEVRVSIPAKDVETASAVAQMTVPYGIYVEDYSDMLKQVPLIAHIDLIDEELLQRDRDKAVVHIYISPEENPMEAVSFIEERLSAEGLDFSVETRGIQEEDWAFGWKKYYHPIKIGRRVVVCPTWEDYAPAPDEVVVRLDPGMAFGTGTHHTTQLCIRLLEETVRPGCALLDMGCGSGILSMAALALGAERAVGVDIDPLAVKIAAQNLHNAGYGPPRFEAVCADLIRDKALAARVGLGCYELVAANIVADAVISLAGVIRDHLRPGGRLVASGIITEREGEVLAALEKAGLAVVCREEQGGWIAILARK